ncbi:MAG: hypothetical protein ACP6IY_19410 [Promethearchaeia archaeon]
MIIQGDIVRIKKKKFKDRIGKVVGYNPITKYYNIKLLSTNEVISCKIHEIKKVLD